VERRAVERGDRDGGLARGTTLVTHRYARYDVDVDTTSRGAEELAREIVVQLA
jgi:chloramphenicol 3-O-phosphotransferase